MTCLKSRLNNHIVCCPCHAGLIAGYTDHPATEKVILKFQLSQLIWCTPNNELTLQDWFASHANVIVQKEFHIKMILD